MTAGFGIERFALLALRSPKLWLAGILAISILCVAGATQLRFNSDIREIFRSGAEDFLALERMTEQFPGSEQDILLVVEGDDLFTVGTLETLRDLHLELRFVEGVREVVSLFSARRVPTRGSDDSPLVVPSDLAEADLESLRDELLDHPLVRGKLLSQTAELALFIIALEEAGSELTTIEQRIEDVSGAASGVLGAIPLRTGLTGFPVMRVEIIGALKRDQRVFLFAGFGLAILLSWLLLRRVRDVVVVCVPPVVSVLALVGSMALRGQEVNILTNGLPALVLVIAFSDSLHLMFGLRGKLSQGLALPAAIGQAIAEVGPACVLTSITTAIALSTLAWVDNPLIAGFGTTAAMGTLIALAATLSTFPALAALLLAGNGRGQGVRSRLHDAAARVSEIVATLVERRSQRLVAIGLVAFCGAAAFYLANEPHYRYRDYLPSDNPVFETMRTVDRELSGTSTLRIHLQWPPGQEILSEETLETVGRAHAILAEAPIVEETWSLESLTAWFTEAGFKVGEVVDYLEAARSDVVARLVAPDSSAMLVTGQIVDVDSSSLIPVLDSLEARLDQLRAQAPEAEITLTGISPVSARMSLEMIAQLNVSLLTAVAIILVLLGLAMRSVGVAIASILPNLLPIACAGTYLYLAGAGLQFTAVVAFTLGFGIAVDTTIHLLNRYRLCSATGVDRAAAMRETLTTVGPVIIVGCLILIAGLGVTSLSEMPSIRLYGRICVIVLSVALVASLLFLPAILRCLPAKS